MPPIEPQRPSSSVPRFSQATTGKPLRSKYYYRLLSPEVESMLERLQGILEQPSDELVLGHLVSLLFLSFRSPGRKIIDPEIDFREGERSKLHVEVNRALELSSEALRIKLREICNLGPEASEEEIFQRIREVKNQESKYYYGLKEPEVEPILERLQSILEISDDNCHLEKITINLSSIFGQLNKSDQHYQEMREAVKSPNTLKNKLRVICGLPSTAGDEEIFQKVEEAKKEDDRIQYIRNVRESELARLRTYQNILKQVHPSEAAAQARADITSEQRINLLQSAIEAHEKIEIRDAFSIPAEVSNDEASLFITNYSAQALRKALNLEQTTQDIDVYLAVKDLANIVEVEETAPPQKSETAEVTASFSCAELMPGQSMIVTPSFLHYLDHPGHNDWFKQFLGTKEARALYGLLPKSSDNEVFAEVVATFCDPELNGIFSRGAMLQLYLTPSFVTEDEIEEAYKRHLDSTSFKVLLGLPDYASEQEIKVAGRLVGGVLSREKLELPLKATNEEVEYATNELNNGPESTRSSYGLPPDRAPTKDEIIEAVRRGRGIK